MSVLLDALEDGTVLERLPLDVLVAVHVDHSVSGLDRPDEHVDLERRRLIPRCLIHGGYARDRPKSRIWVQSPC